MAFNLVVKPDKNSTCDKCRKPGSAERPIVDMWTTGRSDDYRNFIQVHKDCLLKAIAKDEKENANETPPSPF